MFHYISWQYRAGSCRFHSAHLFVYFLYCFLYLSWRRVCEALRTTPTLKSVDAQLIFCWKKNGFLFLFKYLWQQLGVGRNLHLSKQKQKMYDLSKLFWSIFQSFSFLDSARLFVTKNESVYILTLEHFFYYTKWMTWYTTWSSIFWEIVPLPSVFRVQPWMKLYAATAVFSLLPHLSWPICKTKWVIFFLSQLVMAYSLFGHR